MDIDDVLRLIEEHKAEVVDLRFMDFLGLWQQPRDEKNVDVWADGLPNPERHIDLICKPDSVLYAKKLISSINKKSQILNSYPKMGKMVPEIMDESIRELQIPPYRIIYIVAKNSRDVEVLSVIHGKRDFNEVFEYNE